MTHFVRTRNLPFSQDQIRNITDMCRSCSYLKPKFIRKDQGILIKALFPFQRLNIDFKGPPPVSSKGNRYLLTIIDEHSRYPFAYPCRDMTAPTVISCFNDIFSMFGMSEMVHSDRAKDFLSEQLTTYLHSRGIATSKTIYYNPQGNGQILKLNGTLWKAIAVTLHSSNLVRRIFYPMLCMHPFPCCVLKLMRVLVREC